MNIIVKTVNKIKNNHKYGKYYPADEDRVLRIEKLGDDLTIEVDEKFIGDLVICRNYDGTYRVETTKKTRGPKVPKYYDLPISEKVKKEIVETAKSYQIHKDRLEELDNIHEKTDIDGSRRLFEKMARAGQY